MIGIPLPSARYLLAHCCHEVPAVSTFSGTNCATSGVIERSVPSRLSNAWQGAHVLLPATASIGRPVCWEIRVACSIVNAACAGAATSSQAIQHHRTDPFVSIACFPVSVLPKPS